MIHPNTELKKINDIMGYGVFATRFIPKGTILYVKDPLEIEVSPEQFDCMDTQYQTITDWFSYIDERGYRIVSWDIAKYVNHSCESNSISTGYGFEIATKDIDINEEITDEYGIFNLPIPLNCRCGSRKCRKVISGDNWDVYGPAWEKRSKDALKNLRHVDQPLLKYMDIQSYQDLMSYLNTRRNYKSILNLRLCRYEYEEKIG